MPITVNALVAHDKALDEQIRHTSEHRLKIADGILTLDEATESLRGAMHVLESAIEAVADTRRELVESMSALDGAAATLHAVKSASAQDGSVVVEKKEGLGEMDAEEGDF